MVKVKVVSELPICSNDYSIAAGLAYENIVIAMKGRGEIRDVKEERVIEVDYDDRRHESIVEVITIMRLYKEGLNREQLKKFLLCHPSIKTVLFETDKDYGLY